MGSRANLILTTGSDGERSGAYELYYCHWCASSLTSDLFWGPEHAPAFVRQQRRFETDDQRQRGWLERVVASARHWRRQPQRQRSEASTPRGWLDEVWAEGGALIDAQRRVLLLFGGEAILYDIPLRRFYLRLLQRVWRGWDVRWAYEGIVDQADYLGLPRELVLVPAGDDESWDDLSLAAPEEKDWTDGVGSIRWEDGTLRLYPLTTGSTCYVYLHNGTRLLEAARQAGGVETLALDEWTPEFPGGGFHIDMARQTLETWFSSTAATVEERIARHWPPGWAVTWHHDRYEFQLERTEGRLRFQTPSQETLTEQLRQILMPPDEQHSSSQALAEVVQGWEAEGHTVEVNPLALAENPLPLPSALREQIWQEALRGKDSNDSADEYSSGT
jgi:hypothetical protein